jgi:hypothetical protein
MKISFGDMSAEAAVAKINSNLAGRQLGEIVSLQLVKNQLQVVVSKFGTSSFSFTCENLGPGCTFELNGEKIAFAHRAFKNEVIEKLAGVVKTSGGELIAPYKG